MKITKVELDVICKAFNVPDLSYLPRERLAIEYVRQAHYMKYLFTELYCINPAHRVFETANKTALSEMQEIYQRRLADAEEKRRTNAWWRRLLGKIKPKNLST